MPVSSETRKRFALATALRGLLMLVAGIYAVIWPLEALAVLLVFGGILLLIDGALGLWSLTFGGGKSGNYWFDVVANAASLVLGVVILISPLLATIFTVTFISTLVGLAAIVVGVMQIVVIVRELCADLAGGAFGCVLCAAGAGLAAVPAAQRMGGDDHRRHCSDHLCHRPVRLGLAAVSGEQGVIGAPVQR